MPEAVKAHNDHDGCSGVLARGALVGGGGAGQGRVPAQQRHVRPPSGRPRCEEAVPSPSGARTAPPFAAFGRRRRHFLTAANGPTRHRVGDPASVWHRAHGSETRSSGAGRIVNGRKRVPDPSRTAGVRRGSHVKQWGGPPVWVVCKSRNGDGGAVPLEPRAGLPARPGGVGRGGGSRPKPRPGSGPVHAATWTPV